MNPVRQCRPPGSAAVRGFTLVELLVAILIMTLFVSLAMGSVRIGSRSWEAGKMHADEAEDLRATAGFLRRELGRLPPLTWRDGQSERLSLIAAEDRLVFTAPAPRFSTGAGMHVYTLKTERVGGAYDLILAHAPFDPGAEVFAEPAPQQVRTLARGFETIRFDYYGSEMADGEAGWTPYWRPDAERYPIAIRLQARKPNGASWPSLVFRLRTAGSS